MGKNVNIFLLTYRKKKKNLHENIAVSKKKKILLQIIQLLARYIMLLLFYLQPVRKGYQGDPIQKQPTNLAMKNKKEKKEKKIKEKKA